MDPTFLIGLASGVVLVTVVLGCLRCRHKLTDEELQKKYFEKFRKRHMLPRDRILSNRVDYIRNVSECEESVVTSVGDTGSPEDHTYDRLQTPNTPTPAIQVQEPSVCSDHSFFDDSFQTVIEASSGGISAGMTSSDCLSLPANDASYLSLQKLSQTDLTCLSDSLESQLPKQGELNAGFSDSSNSTGSSVHQTTTDSLDNTYIVPRTGPKIKIVQPSVRRTPLTDTTRSEFARRFLKVESHRSGSFRRHSDVGVAQTRDEDNSHDLFDRSFGENGSFWDENDGCPQNVHKLVFEGPTHYGDRRHSYDSMTLYEKLRRSKMEDPLYKSLQKKTLVLPRRVENVCTPLTRVGVCTPSPNTRSKVRFAIPRRCSITSELGGEMNRRSSTDAVMNDLSSMSPGSPNIQETSRDRLINTPSHRGSYTDYQNDLDDSTHHTYETIPSENRNLRYYHTDDCETPNDLSSSAHHTYESLPSQSRNPRLKLQDTCENSAVIIGRRVSNPFDNKFSKRTINKKKQNCLRENKLVNQSERKLSNDSDRYSPFPSAKKLAFKSAFKQAASPRFSMIQSVSGNMNPNINPKLEFSIDNLDIGTPEIKVENNTQYIDNTAFVSPIEYNKYNVYADKEKESNVLNIVTTEIAYQTLKACENLKQHMRNLHSETAEKYVNYKKSLPSLSDCMEEDLFNHCSGNMYTKSTPCVPEPHTTNYF